MNKCGLNEKYLVFDTTSVAVVNNRIVSSTSRCWRAIDDELAVCQVCALMLQPCQIYHKNKSDWPQMGQNREFFRSDFSTFWRVARQNVLNSDLKKPNLAHFLTKCDSTELLVYLT